MAHIVFWGEFALLDGDRWEEPVSQHHTPSRCRRCAGILNGGTIVAVRIQSISGCLFFLMVGLFWKKSITGLLLRTLN